MLNVEKVLNGFECNYKTEILERIDFDGDLSEFIDYLENGINDDGSIDEIVDNQIDLYYYDLRAWAVDNYEYIENFLLAFGFNGEDYHKLIEGGQYMYYNEQVNECLSDMVDHIQGAYNVN